MLCQFVWAQSTPPSLTVTAANTVVNTYYPGKATVNAGARSIVLGNAAGSNTPIAKGDVVLIIQVQGAVIDATNSGAYGDGVSGDPASGFKSSVAGTYEMAVAANNVPVSGGTLYLTRRLTNAYTHAEPTSTAAQYRFQVVRVPVTRALHLTAIPVLRRPPGMAVPVVL